ncbi:MAG: hypothetical protein LBG14_08080 [Treponema sp.]|jgi:anthranilate synthase component 1|nr:hypothetical protein [Treponema sp.]
MDYAPGTEQFEALVKNYRRIPLWKTLDAGTRSPAETFRVLKNLSRQRFILESLEDAEQRGRYTFLGYDPRLEISCAGGVLWIKNGANLEVNTTDPGSYINRIIEDNRSPRMPELPPFTGGLAGYFSYDYIAYAEPSLKRVLGGGDFPVYGVQFHPESILTPEGKRIAQNFLDIQL